MGRRSLKEERRRGIVGAYARVLAVHGRGGATVERVAAEAGVAPGLVHHYFADKADLERALLETLIRTFRERAATAGAGVEAYVDAALALGSASYAVAARAWVGMFAAALADPELFDRVRALLDTEIAAIGRRSAGSLDVPQASAVLAFIIGALVFGAFAPRKTSGFAAPMLKRALTAWSQRPR